MPGRSEDPSHLRVGSPPLVPELQLYLADDIEQLWQELGTPAPPFWAFAWLGGQAVARYVLDAPHTVSGLRVLDLATGSGLVALAAAKAGAAQVLAVDVDPRSDSAVRRNAGLNGLYVDVVLQDLLDEKPPDMDVVLAGDVCYDRDMTPRVLAWLARTDAQVLLGDPGRSYLPQTGWAEVASYDIPTTRSLEGVEMKRTKVFTRESREI
jgi:predicted nicotinamide N-methyase